MDKSTYLLTDTSTRCSETQPSLGCGRDRRKHVFKSSAMRFAETGTGPALIGGCDLFPLD